MATLKHIASKNSDYTAIEAYLVYQHDAFTGKQLLDEQSRPKLRESYLLDTLECGAFSFATACLLANRKYGKNTQHGDIKSHQYIISFDPRDAADNGLTMEKSQALGLKFCEENFPGHPAIVCTHPDGHNRSGNIHVHIVIGSVRTREVERKPYMQKPRDWLEGMKHSSTAQTMRHLRVEVMELCESAGLYQIDLLNGSKERVSEAEYWVRRRGQLKLDRENAALTADGQQPRQKKFETLKDTLRKQISSVLYRTTSFEEFSDRLMQQYSFSTYNSHSELCEAMTISKGYRRPKFGYFLRAESFYNVATKEIDYSDDDHPSKGYHQKSHGESFLAIAQDYMGADGVYIFDEPEAALSPQRQLTLLINIYRCAQEGAQFIIVSHSPILLGMPDAEIFSFDNGTIHPCQYEDTDSYVITKTFVNNRQHFLNQLLNEET